MAGNAIRRLWRLIKRGPLHDMRAGKGGKQRAVVMSRSLAIALDAIPPTMRGEYVLPYRSRTSA